MKNLTIAPPMTGADCPASCGSEGITKFQAAMRVVTGKWKIEIVAALACRPLRFGELRRSVPGITQHMLTVQLRELATHGLLVRTVHTEMPPHVSYELTEAAYALQPTYQALLIWAERYGDPIAVDAP